MIITGAGKPSDRFGDGSGTAVRPLVLGALVDAETRCVHYRTELDVIAIKFRCCGDFYPCHLCHRDAVDHPAAQWPAEQSNERSVLCGVCGTLLTIAEYADAHECPACAAPFNPGCKLHWEYYFGVEDVSTP